MSEALSDVRKYPTFVRTTAPYSSWIPAIIGFLRWARWQRIAVVTSDEVEFTQLALQLAQSIATNEVRFSAVYVDFADAVFKHLLQRPNRVVLVLGSARDVLTIAHDALIRGLTLGWA
jgi:hypothetical protein